MKNFDIIYPCLNHKNYIEGVYEFCKSNKFSMILKGSLAKGTATKYSDIDFIILGNIENSKIDEIITLYGNPIMTNFTQNPKDMLSLVYSDNISVDLDVRETISQEDLENNKILLKYDDNFVVNNESIIRKHITSSYMPNRPAWYIALRLLHRGINKYLSNKIDSAYILLSEVKENLNALGLSNLDFNNKFQDDVQHIFDEFCKNFEIDIEIKILFNSLFKALS